MATAATIDVLLRANTATYRAAMIDAGRVTNQQLGGIQAEVKQTAAAMQQMRSAAVGIISVQALRAGVGALLDVVKQNQALVNSMKASVGSTALAADSLAFVSQTAKELGLSYQSAAEGFQRLTASATANGVAMQDQQQLFLEVSRAATSMHIAPAQVDRAMTALSQSFSKGRFQAEELRQQLAEAIPGAVPHFHKAVMQMVQGTELADKSFDQLLQGGLLDVKRFLPAMTQAFAEMGKNWRDGAGSLQAETNKLGNAWRELKLDLANGPFNDAATTSVKLMADNLESLAGAATLAAGVISARLVGKGIAAGAGGVGSIIAEINATAALTAAKVAESEQSVVSGAIKAREAAQNKILAAEKIQNAVTQNELNIATANYARVATAAARANGAYQASLAGLRGAQAANAAAQGAATAGGMALGAAGAVGRYGLALVGGPVGAAVLTIGALGIAYANMVRKGEAARAEFKLQVESLDSLNLALEEIGREYKSGEAGVKTIAGYWNAAGAEMRKAERDAQALRDRIKVLSDLQESINYANANRRPGQEYLTFFNAEDLKDAQAALAKLDARIDPIKVKFQRLEGELKKALDPATFEALRVAAMKADDGADFKKLLAALPEIKRKALDAADAIGKIAAAGNTDNWNRQVARIKREQGEYRAWLAEQARSYMDAFKTNSPEEAFASLSPAQRKDFQERAKFVREDVAAAKAWQDQQSSSKQIDKDAEYTQSFIRNAEARQKEYQFELAAGENLSESKRALLKFELDLRDSKNASLKANEGYIRSILEENVSLEEQRLARARLIEQKQREMALNRQIADYMDSMQQRHERDLSAITTGGSDAVRKGITADISDEFRARRRDIDRSHEDRLIGIPEDDQVRRNEEQKQYLSLLGQTVIAEAAAKDRALSNYDEILAAQADWKNGMATAFADYSLLASDVAGQTNELFTNAFKGAEDAIVEFVKTGKLNFSSLVDSIIADMARMYAKQLLGQAAGWLAGMFAPQGTQNYEWAKSSGFGNNYDGGGYTGPGGRLQPAGVVHKGEVVWSQTDVARAGGVAAVEGMRRGIRGYAEGGAVGSRVVAAGGVNVQLEVNSYGAPATARQETTRMPDGSELRRFIVDVVADDTASGGRTARAQKQRFNLRETV